MPKHPPPPAFHIMTKPRGAICNLDCRYCFFLSKENLFPDSAFRMSDDLLDEYTRQYIEAQRVPEVTFAWQGGEPTLMGVDFFRKAIAYQKKHRKPGMIVRNALQTNGTLLDDEWGQFLREQNFLVGLSLDGPRELHDAYRVDKGGAPTFERVMAGLQVLKDHHIDYNILACVHAANMAHPLEVYRFFRDEIKARHIQFIPIVERDNQTGFQDGTRVTDRSVTGKAYGEFLITIFDEWVRSDVGQIFVQIFDVSLAAWVGERPGLCIFEETCGTALAIEHTGDLYSCDHFVEPAFHLGNIREQDMLQMVASDRQVQFGKDKRDTLPTYCCECEVRFICNGGCPKNRILHTPSGEPGLNYLCEGYRPFFNHIDGPMKLMATLLRRGRPPAEVMKLVGEASSHSEASPEQARIKIRRRRKKG